MPRVRSSSRSCISSLVSTEGRLFIRIRDPLLRYFFGLLVFFSSPVLAYVDCAYTRIARLANSALGWQTGLPAPCSEHRVAAGAGVSASPAHVANRNPIFAALPRRFRVRTVFVRLVIGGDL